MRNTLVDSARRRARAEEALARGDFVAVLDIIDGSNEVGTLPLEEFRLLGLAAILGNVDETRRACMAEFEALTESEKSDTLRIWSKQAAELLHYKAAANLIYPLVEASPDDPELLSRLAYYYLMAGHVPESAQTLERAKHFGADNPGVWQTAVSVHETRGELDRAQDAARRALELDRLSIPAFEAMCSHAPEGIDEELEQRFMHALKSGAIKDARHRAAVLYAVARSRDRQGRFEESFAALAEANQIQQRLYYELGEQFSESAERARIEGIARQTEMISALGEVMEIEDEPGLTPVFIVGMPRSGSTLLERIIAAHPEACALGERVEIPQFFAEMARLAVAAEKGRASDEAMTAARDMRRRYLSRHEIDPRRHAVIVDKLPDNFRYLGFIRWLYPAARIILAHRDPRDVAISIFATPFPRNLPYATDLCDIAAMTHCCRDAVRYWRGRGVELLKVDYESVVGDLESEARRMLAHCGLDWDPACRDFHKTAAPVNNASVLQVRRPLYRSSLGRWRRYERQLAPLIASLRSRGLIE